MRLQWFNVLLLVLQQVSWRYIQEPNYTDSMRHIQVQRRGLSTRGVVHCNANTQHHQSERTCGVAAPTSGRRDVPGFVILKNGFSHSVL